MNNTRLIRLTRSSLVTDISCLFLANDRVFCPVAGVRRKWILPTQHRIDRRITAQVELTSCLFLHLLKRLFSTDFMTKLIFPLFCLFSKDTILWGMSTRCRGVNFVNPVKLSPTFRSQVIFRNECAQMRLHLRGLNDFSCCTVACPKYF